MKSGQWKTYRTRFLVKAKQLSCSLTFVDHLGRQHSGRKGDYLVESADGVLSIAPRRIFEDIYVSMSLRQEPEGDPALRERTAIEPGPGGLRFEPLDIEEIKLPKPPASHQRVEAGRLLPHDDAVHVRRKLPQSCRLRPSSAWA
jgi:hypothetical protein